ncbi:hypothetical protein A8709_25860 [Paenibacillus pectinilyticus]|uniref:BIG2 domain-containing protein n=1 Tax=Paenibacillus pectinilyticus TaxID=512399 RepID=A0A1C1A154_9BACL|nr:DUF5057 domain-containing protein [Paenibacillus pectinilyticus]OCT14258.1 hypothetical protein A8709_25860 [Paenibacillus pectinilyticus]
MLPTIHKKISLILFFTLLASILSLIAGPMSHTAHAATGDSVTVALQASNNKYLSPDSSDSSKVKASTTSPWFSELFDLIDQGDGNVALKSRSNGKYVSVGSSANSSLKADSSTVGNTEKFTQIVNTNGTISLKSVSFNYLSVPSSSSDGITPNVTSSNASQFKLTYFDLTKPIKILEIKDLEANGSATSIVSDLATTLGSNTNLQIETMSIKKFVALRDELDGKYDAIYFGKSLFNPTSETGNNHNTRYEENDITPLKATELTDKYITKGLPVIVYSDSSTNRGALYQGYLNNGTWTRKSGNLFALFNPYNTTTPQSNVIFVNNTDIGSLSAFLTKTNLLTSANVRPQLNVTNKPLDYTLSANRSASYKAGDTLSYTFNVSNIRNLAQRNLVANLYLGTDSVLKFDATKLVQSVAVTSLTNNTISFVLPKGYSGLYYWRLELVDQTSTGKLKDATFGVFHYQDQAPQINVLQVLPNSQSSNLTSSLKLESNLKQNYLHSDDYQINITVTDFNKFNSTDYSTLNGKYDMVIFGFNDSYNQTGDISATAAAAVKSFIATGQGVMFTHDTVYQGNQTWITNFQAATGQIGPMTNMGLNAPNTSTSTVKVNEGLLTEFPFFISEMTPQVATTHDQYFRLNLNDADVIPWYNINGSPRDIEDSWNHYYTYSKGNVTYSGTGHNFVNTSVNSTFPDWEQKLFVNTMYRAFIGSNHKPTVDILSPVAFDTTSKNYISANSDISVSFKPNDLDLNDKKVTSSIIFKYKDSQGTNQAVTVLSNFESNKGETINKSFTNPLSASGGDLTISVSTRDAAGALETKEVIVKVITSTSLTPDRTISTDKIEVNDPVTVNYAIKPTAKTYSAATNISDLTISGIHFKEVFPANLELVSYPTNLKPSGTLATGFTLEGDITSIPYRKEGNQFVGDPTTFTIVVKPKSSGDFSLSNANLTYNDFASSNSQNVLFSNKVFTAFIKITSLSLDDLTIARGDTTKLIPKILPITATYKKNEDFTWSSDASSIVSVNASGEINGLAAGTAKITATAKDGSGLVATSVVSVIQPGLNITGPTQVAVDASINLTAALVTVNENVTSVRWSSSDASTASIASSSNNAFIGVLDGHHKGSVTITATVVTDKGRTYTKDYTVSVFIPVTSVAIGNKTIRVGETTPLTPSYLPLNADYPSFAWSSDRTDLVSVDANGTITGKAVGTTQVTVRSTDGSNRVGSATITVMQPSMTVSGPNSVFIGDKITLEASLTTVNEDISTITWRPDAQDKASFATDGDNKRVLTGVQTGTVTGIVTITTNKGNVYTGNFTVAVKPVLITSVTLSPATIRIGETYASNSSILPANASNKILNWTSSNTAIATVDQSGNVRGVATGDATITATATDGTNSKSSAKFTVMQPTITVSGPTSVIVEDQITLAVSLNTVNEQISSITWRPDAQDKASFVTNGDDKRILTGVKPGTVIGTVTIVTDKGNTYTGNFSVLVKPILIQSITLTGSSTIRLGETSAVATNIMPLNATYQNLSWSSSNPAIATVDQNGNVHGVAVGEVTITATSTDGSNRTGSVKITVMQPTITVSGPTSVIVEDQITLAVSLNTVNEQISSITWRPDAQDKASFAYNGEDKRVLTGVTPGNVIGTVMITTDKGNTYTGTFSVTVKPILIKSISLSGTTIRVKETYTIVPSISPLHATNQQLNWSSSNPAIATVDQRGNVYGVAAGEVTITAKSMDTTDITATTSIKVMQPVVTIDNHSNLLRVGSEMTLIGKLDTVNETILSESIKWSTGENDKVTLTNIVEGDSYRGIITGSSPGIVTATITLKTDKNNIYTASTSFTVYTLSLPNSELDINESADLQPIINPSNLDLGGFNWSSSDTSIVTVDQNGQIEAKKIGTSTITIVSKTYPAVSATGVITVIQPGVQLTTLDGNLGVSGSSSLLVGDTLEIKAAFVSTNQTVKSITWSITDPSNAVSYSTDDYARVFEGKRVGVVTGKLTVLTNKDKSYTSTFTINVTNPVRSVAIDGKSDTINVGDPLDLTAVISRQDAAHDGFKWTILSEDGNETDVAQLNQKTTSQVTLTGQNQGKVIVTVVVGGKSASKTITVNQIITHVSLPDGPITLIVDSTNPSENSVNLWTPMTIVPSSLKDEIRNQLQWSASDPSITVSDGLVTAVRVGTSIVTVTITNADGSTLNDSVQIIVVEKKKYQNKY